MDVGPAAAVVAAAVEDAAAVSALVADAAVVSVVFAVEQPRTALPHRARASTNVITFFMIFLLQMCELLG
jgi:hypothetical protein